MLLRRFADFLLRNRLHSMGVAFVCGFTPLFGLMSILIAALITLVKGVAEGVLITLFATLGAVAWYVLYPVDNPSGVMLSTASIIVIIAIGNGLAWGFALVLRKYSNWSLVLQLAALLCLIVIAAVHLFHPNIQEWWQETLTNYIVNAIRMAGQLTDVGDVQPGKAQIAEVVAAFKPYATGAAIAILVFNALLALLLARWWQAAAFNPGGLRKELYKIRLSYAAGVLFLIGFVGTWFWSNNLLVDMMPILYLTFGLAGLSVIHSVIGSSKISWFLLGLIYLATLLAPQCLVLVSMVGFMDIWVDLRERLKRKV